MLIQFTIKKKKKKSLILGYHIESFGRQNKEEQWIKSERKIVLFSFEAKLQRLCLFELKPILDYFWFAHYLFRLLKMVKDGLLRAFTSGLSNGICRTDLALKPKNPQHLGL